MVLDTAALTGASPKFGIWRVSWTTPNRCLGNPDFFLAFRLDGGLLIGARRARAQTRPTPPAAGAQDDHQHGDPPAEKISRIRQFRKSVSFHFISQATPP